MRSPARLSRTSLLLRQGTLSPTTSQPREVPDTGHGDPLWLLSTCQLLREARRPPDPAPTKKREPPLFGDRLRVFDEELDRVSWAGGGPFPARARTEAGVALAVAVLELGSLLLALSLTLAWAPGLSGSAPPAQGLVGAVILLFSCAIAFQYFDLYNVRTVRTWDEFTPRFAASVPMALIITSLGWALLLPDSAPAALYFALLLVTFGLLVPARAITFTLLGTPLFDRRVLLVGNGPLADRIVREIARAKGYSIVGQCLHGSALSNERLSPAEQRVLLARLQRLITEARPNVVVVALHERRGRVPTQALLGARIGGAHVVEGAAFYEEVARKLAIENMQPSGVIFCTKLTKSRTRLFLHRAFSFGLAAFAVIVTAPLMAAIAILIKLDSEGPVLFVQPRVGRGGRLFPLLKFRTMRGEPRPGEDIWHRHDDGRITHLGSFLRRRSEELV